MNKSTNRKKRLRGFPGKFDYKINPLDLDLDSTMLLGDTTDTGRALNNNNQERAPGE